MPRAGVQYCHFAFFSTTKYEFLLAEKFEQSPNLQCLVLKDEADPGFPSFFVLSAKHLATFSDQLLPQDFVNQGGDPFLFELYRSIGAVDSLSAVSINNKRGDIVLCNTCAFGVQCQTEQRERNVVLQVDHNCTLQYMSPQGIVVSQYQTVFLNNTCETGNDSC